ncbi:MAG: SDR family NAD(P)-dependent oxidoreductase [Planctomycetia bacterium]
MPAPPTAARDSGPRPTALVIGGGGGIGAEVVQGLVAHGWAVAIHAHASFARARATAESLAAAGVPALAVTADLRDEGPVRALVHRVADHFGSIDALVTCAIGRRETPLADLTADGLRARLDLGLIGVAVLAQEVGAVMAGQPAGGTIVLVGEAAASPPRPGGLARAIVAGAIPGLARALAAESADARVRVHAMEAEEEMPVAEAAAAVIRALADGSAA